MHTFSSVLKKDAEEIGAAMLARGEHLAEVPFGDTKNCIFVSRDRDAVNWTEIIEVNSTTLYIGTKRKKPNP